MSVILFFIINATSFDVAELKRGYTSSIPRMYTPKDIHYLNVSVI